MGLGFKTGGNYFSAAGYSGRSITSVSCLSDSALIAHAAKGQRSMVPHDLVKPHSARLRLLFPNNFGNNRSYVEHE